MSCNPAMHHARQTPPDLMGRAVRFELSTKGGGGGRALARPAVPKYPFMSGKFFAKGGACRGCC